MCDDWSPVRAASLAVRLADEPAGVGGGGGPGRRPRPALRPQPAHGLQWGDLLERLRGMRL